MGPVSAACRDCGQSIIWAITEKRARIALNPTRLGDDEGKFAVSRDVHGVWQARVPTEENRRDTYEHMYDPHIATCPAEARRRELAAEPVPNNVIPFQRHARSR